MKYLLAGMLLLLSVGASEARTYRNYHTGHGVHCARGHCYQYYVKRHVTTHRFSKHLASRHWRYTHRHYRRYMHIARASAPCYYQAASMGGPCGCVAAWKILRVADHVWHGRNLWLAWDWAQFRRAEPGPGTAAVWKNHSHVAAVKFATKDTIIVDDYWGVHPVSRSAVIIVDPRPRKVAQRITGAWPL